MNATAPLDDDNTHAVVTEKSSTGMDMLLGIDPRFVWRRISDNPNSSMELRLNDSNASLPIEEVRALIAACNECKMSGFLHGDYSRLGTYSIKGKVDTSTCGDKRTPRTGLLTTPLDFDADRITVSAPVADFRMRVTAQTYEALMQRRAQQEPAGNNHASRINSQTRNTIAAARTETPGVGIVCGNDPRFEWLESLDASGFTSYDLEPRNGRVVTASEARTILAALHELNLGFEPKGVYGVQDNHYRFAATTNTGESISSDTLNDLADDTPLTDFHIAVNARTFGRLRSNTRENAR